MTHRAGYVNIIGYPNVGKSTLMNALVGERLSIVTNKAQTTRHLIHGIVNGDDYQIVFSDTPGILKPGYKLQEKMMNFVSTAIEDADIFIVMVESGQRFFDEFILEKINSLSTPILLLINKIDLLKADESLDDIINYWNTQIPKAKILPISALHSFNMGQIVHKIIELLPESPPYFPKDQLTDKNMRFFISEIIREQILKLYKKEVPYSVEVVVEEYLEESDIIRIKANIFVVRETQKIILIGQNGRAIKRLGIDSRKEIEKFIDKHIFLELTVKVRKNWRDDDKLLKNFGYAPE